MISAGISIHEALGLLAESAETDNEREILAGLSLNLASGRTLSASMSVYSSSFSSYFVGLIRVGEKTGALARILDTLATHSEKSEALRLKLKSAVTYPAFLIAGSLLLITIGPSYLLEGQLAILERSGQELPVLTRGLIFWSDLVTSPLFLLLCAGSVVGLVSLLSREEYRRKLVLLLHQMPLFQDFLTLVATARFARALEISLKSGLPLLAALPLSAEAAADPLLIARTKITKTGLVQGDTLKEALKDAGFFSPSVVSLVASGEESGKLPVMLALIAQFAELELELAIRRATLLVEPVILLVMGILTALILVATLQPTLSLLEAL